MAEQESLKFASLDSMVDTAFWHALSKRKLEEYQLEEGPFPISGEFTNGTALGLSPRLNIDLNSLNQSGVIPETRNNVHHIDGSIVILNNLEKFKDLDKQAFIDEFGRENLFNTDYMKQPNSLLTFVVLTHLDLKHHHFFYWFAFPSPVQEHKPQLLRKSAISEKFTSNQINSLTENYDIWRKTSSDIFFSARCSGELIKISNIESVDIESKEDYFGVCDPSADPNVPGWPVRNLLAALSTRIKTTQEVKVICFRDRYTHGERLVSHSLVLHVQLQPETKQAETKFIGWERHKDKLQPRLTNLSATMDPVKLAESAVDLNLKLMLWRMMPDLDLSNLHRTRCLILGAGTLGCNVGRQLLAWGFRSMTFVDNSPVSYSNPVRQTLYTFEDAKANARKATAAAEAIKRIFPSADVHSADLTIPMPGHPVSNSSATGRSEEHIAEVKKAFTQLEELIRSHDVVFLLLDTREARWLPTLLATFHGKIAITAALGFDSYLVMRHGVPQTPGSAPTPLAPRNPSSSTRLVSIHGSSLGCYFCNDVVGPTNSTIDRTLDQQCTVSRPGTSMLASALAVEVCVGLLQHPDRGHAPAFMNHAAVEQMHQNDTFGLLPHQIRGFLAQFSEVLPCTAAFSHCTACSQLVLDEYAKNGFGFLLRVFDDADYLETVAGLKELQLSTAIGEVLVLGDDDDLDD